MRSETLGKPRSGRYQWPVPELPAMAERPCLPQPTIPSSSPKPNADHWLQGASARLSVWLPPHPLPDPERPHFCRLGTRPPPPRNERNHPDSSGDRVVCFGRFGVLAGYLVSQRLDQIQLESQTFNNQQVVNQLRSLKFMLDS